MCLHRVHYLPLWYVVFSFSVLTYNSTYRSILYSTAARFCTSYNAIVRLFSPEVLTSSGASSLSSSDDSRVLFSIHGVVLLFYRRNHSIFISKKSSLSHESDLKKLWNKMCLTKQPFCISFIFTDDTKYVHPFIVGIHTICFALCKFPLIFNL